MNNENKQLKMFLCDAEKQKKKNNLAPATCCPLNNTIKSFEKFSFLPYKYILDSNKIKNPIPSFIVLILLETNLSKPKIIMFYFQYCDLAASLFFSSTC